MLRPYNETSRDDTALVARMLCLWHDAERGRTPGRVYVRPTPPRALRGCVPRPHAKGVAAAAPLDHVALPGVVASRPRGGAPLFRVQRLAAKHGFRELLVKDEAANPTGSFKARGLAAARTRAALGGARSLVVPTAGNAGVALAAYGARAGIAARVYAPASTPPVILSQIRGFGADLVLVDGHIGDCGKAARAYATETGAVDVSTLREPYRIEGKKTLGLELREQLDWTFPDAIVYPTGGGTGLIGMWKAFAELAGAGWVGGGIRPPRMYSVQAAGCAPVVRGFEAGADPWAPWPDRWTIAAGLRVPAPLGDRLMLRALRESGGGAVAVTDAQLAATARDLQTLEGIDACPEGGAALAGAIALKRSEERRVGKECRSRW